MEFSEIWFRNGFSNEKFLNSYFKIPKNAKICILFYNLILAPVSWKIHFETWQSWIILQFIKFKYMIVPWWINVTTWYITLYVDFGCDKFDMLLFQMFRYKDLRCVNIVYFNKKLPSLLQYTNFHMIHVFPKNLSNHQ